MLAGKRVTVFYVKNPDNTNTELSKAHTSNPQAVQIARAKAIEVYGREKVAVVENVSWLVDQYFE